MTILEQEEKNTYRRRMSMNQPITADMISVPQCLPGIDWNTRQRKRLQKAIDDLYGPSDDEFGEGLDLDSETAPSAVKPKDVQKKLFDTSDDTRGETQQILSGDTKPPMEPEPSQTVHPHDDEVRQGKIQQGRKIIETRKRRLRHGF